MPNLKLAAGVALAHPIHFERPKCRKFSTPRGPSLGIKQETGLSNHMPVPDSVVESARVALLTTNPTPWHTNFRIWSRRKSYNHAPMKTLTKPGLILAFLLFGLPSYGSTLPVTLPLEVTNEIAANRITNRLEEIKAMDKSTLTAKEKRALRKEVKEMKRELSPDGGSSGGGGGIYLSIGAIIIIILLLIILL